MSSATTIVRTAQSVAENSEVQVSKLINLFFVNNLSLNSEEPFSAESYGGEELTASRSSQSDSDSASTATPDKAGALSPEQHLSSRSNSVAIKLDISSSDAGSSEGIAMSDSYSHSLSRFEGSHSNPDFAATYAQSLLESSEVITVIEVSENDPAAEDSTFAQGSHSDAEWSELSQSYGSTAGNSRHSDIDWSDLSTSVHRSSQKRAPSRGMLREVSFSTSKGSGEEDWEDALSGKSPEELTQALNASFPYKSTVLRVSLSKVPDDVEAPTKADTVTTRHRSKSDSHLVSDLSQLRTSVIALSEIDDFEDLAPRSKSTVQPPVAGADRKNKRKSPARSVKSSTSDSSKNSKKSVRSAGGSRSSSRSKKKLRAPNEAESAKSTANGRVPILSLLKGSAKVKSPRSPRGASDSSDSGDSPKRSRRPKSKRSIENSQQSADKINRMVEKIAAEVAEQETVLHAKKMASEVHRSHADELSAIAPDLEEYADTGTPRVPAGAALPALPDEMYNLKLLDAQDGVMKSISSIQSAAEAHRFVIVFLRQLGCVFCRRRMSELVALKPRLDSLGVPLICVSNGSEKHAKKLLAEIGLTCPVLLDKPQKLYKLMNLQRGLRPALLNSKTLSKLGETLRMGFRQGTTSGDQLQLGGYFVCQGQKVLFAHVDRFSGDNADRAALEGVCGL